MEREIEKKAFCYGDNSVLIDCVKLSLLKREYLSSAVNLFTNSYKVLRITTRDIFQLFSLQNDHSI